MKVPYKEMPDIHFHFMSMATDWVERIDDDNLWQFQASVDNGDFNRDKKNKVRLKVFQKNADAEAIANGGLAVFSNLKKSMIRKALLTGLEYMMRTGQLSPEDFSHAVQESSQDPDQAEGAGAG